jgi:hypothetical protein
VSPAVLEAPAGAGGQQPAKAVLGYDRDRLLGDDWRAHPSHRVDRDLVFLLQPPVQNAQHLVAGSCRGSGPAAEQVAEEGLQVGSTGAGQASAAAGEERLGLAGAL